MQEHQRLAALLAHAARHHGIFTSSDWGEAGLSSSRLSDGVAAGRFEHLHPTAFRVAGSPLTWRSELMAGVAGAGALALGSHRSAAAMWALAGERGRLIEITTPRHQRVKRFGIRVHESLDLPTMDRFEVDRIPVTGVQRTLLDVARFVPRPRLGDMVDDAVRRDLTSYAALAVWLEMTARRGVRGVQALRGVLAERPGGSAPLGSTFERLMRDLLRRHDLPEPERQVPVATPEGTFLLDFAWPRSMVGVEADGREFHTLTSQIEHDHWRQNLIQLKGWMLLRYTPSALRNRPTAIVKEVRFALTSTTMRP